MVGTTTFRFLHYFFIAIAFILVICCLFVDLEQFVLKILLLLHVSVIKIVTCIILVELDLFTWLKLVDLWLQYCLNLLIL